MKVDPYSPILPPKYLKADVSALQAVQAGTANEHQQKRALNYIINNMCQTYDFPYRPDQRETDIALGKQFIGQQIVFLLKLNKEEIKDG